MKYFFLLLLTFSSATHLTAQSDSTIIYLDGDEEPCPEDKATRYAIQTKEKGYWKKVVFDILLLILVQNRIQIVVVVHFHLFVHFHEFIAIFDVGQ